jgi:hypothetical protein
MSDPFWLADAIAACPDQAAPYFRVKDALQALPANADTGPFVDLYEQLLEARDRLYDAWIALEFE